ncbi:protein containing DUF1566 [Candidatus Thiomargarita nelsonii]|uniref:Protein containing DUF1566 n=1 Tax=Candidatus Thiomargarita nelsonii TaxID=1003181 RepID=A0A176S2P0_9GAMM|nr:protein containing DUF1566 [Candidatus Thiomargarita nelsonii]
MDYAPPEQQGLSEYGKPSAQSDVFSFGATMYRLWTGESPRYFRERELPEVTELRDLLFDCVKTDPRQRPESAGELVSRLKAISESQNAVQRAIEPEEQAKKRQAEKERKIKEDEKAWQQACQSDNKSAYQGYLSGNTVKKYADDAKKRLQAIEEEELAKKRQAEEERIRAEAKKRQQVQSYRYTDNGDGTVTDNQTGLIWLKKANCSGRSMTWKEAMQWAAELAHGQCGLSDGSKAGDWRLPTKEEWEAMVDNRYKKPALCNAAGTGQWKEGDAFSGVQTGSYWPSTTHAGLTSIACLVYLNFGNVNNVIKAFSRYVWPVRGGH